MKIHGHSGIRVHNDSDGFQVVLDSDTRDLLEYIREIRQISGHYTGFAFANNLADVDEDVKMMKTWYFEDRDLREDNPAVKEAWEHYQMMLVLAKQDKS